MVPLDTTNEVLCKDDVFDYLKGRVHIPLADALYVMLRSYQEMYKRAYGDIDYPIIHDPTVIYYILHPEKFIVKDVCFYYKLSAKLSLIRVRYRMEGPMSGIMIQNIRRISWTPLTR